jgi:GNAT superfamily N-acetyltransferase
MNRVLELHDAEALARHLETPLYTGFDVTALANQRVDLHLVGTTGSGAPNARCSLWWREVPPLPGETPGVIGHFSADDETGARVLFGHAFRILRSQGVSVAVGPMDGNTWRSYRLVTGFGTEPRFFMEPHNPAEWPAWFEAAGFEPLARYSSAITNELLPQDARIPAAIARFRQGGVHWRPLDMTRFDDELRAIYRLSVESFPRNFLYTPISEAEFLAQYLPIRSLVRPELTLMAERNGALAGYLFGIPDLEQARRGDPVDRFIIKTVAVESQRRSAGLGRVLVAESQRIARTLGFRQAIHALMHDGNLSRNISGHYARTMRRYTLFQRRLSTHP